MRYLLQRPLPDELLSSALIRSARRAGVSIGTFTKMFTGRKWEPGFFQAGHITDISAPLRIQPLELLWNHTVFSYSTRFFAADVFHKALAAAHATGHGATGMGAVTQSVSDHSRRRRFCSTCAKEDVRQWGESYWHRSHSLPGVLLCLRHGAILQQTALRISGLRTCSQALPHEVDGDKVLKGKLTLFDRELGRRSVAVLTRPFGEGQGRDIVWYRDALLAQGLLSPHRQVNVEKLAGWALGVIGRPLTKLGLVGDDLKLHWLALMVRPNTGIPFIPLKHLVFESALAAYGCCTSPAVDHIPSGPSGQPEDELDRRYAAALKVVIRRYRARGEKVRISDAMTEAGCWSAFRHARERFPRTATVLEKLRNSPQSMRPPRTTTRKQVDAEA